ncbi:hypothetical protein HC030_11190 [Planosporangium mesophilum]|nr:hypothetical protein [Planosporangium mesophilum]
MLLLLKLLLAPILVVGSSLAGRRWGAHVTGMLVALPVVAGPILLITCLEHGARFGARAASAALLGLVSLAAFVVTFAWCSRVYGWVGSLLVSWGVTLGADVALSRFTLSAAWGLVVVLMAAWAAMAALPAPQRHEEVLPATSGGQLAWPWWDLPGRAVATAALVAVVTGAAGALGPNLTGVLAPFPTAISVVAAFALAQQGTAGAVRTLRGVPRGLLGFSVFCFLVAVLVESVGVATAFGGALSATLAVQFTWRWALARRDVHQLSA